jgi:hypothetical protein
MNDSFQFTKQLPLLSQTDEVSVPMWVHKPPPPPPVMVRPVFRAPSSQLHRSLPSQCVRSPQTLRRTITTPFFPFFQHLNLLFHVQSQRLMYTGKHDLKPAVGRLSASSILLSCELGLWVILWVGFMGYFMGVGTNFILT